MHTPVAHGSAVMIVTATGSDTQVGRITVPPGASGIITPIK